MTTIAVRDGILAVDTLTSTGSRPYGHIRKLGRSKDGWWAAGYGDAAVIQAFLVWMEKKKIGSLRPPWTGLPEGTAWDKTGMILLAPDASVHFFEGYGPVEVTAPFIAEGSGAQLAIGAMEAGEGAIRALVISSRHDFFTGGRINYVSAGFDGLGVVEVSR